MSRKESRINPNSHRQIFVSPHDKYIRHSDEKRILPKVSRNSKYKLPNIDLKLRLLSLMHTFSMLRHLYEPRIVNELN